MTDVFIKSWEVWKQIEETDVAIRVKQCREKVYRDTENGEYSTEESEVRRRTWLFKDNQEEWPTEVQAMYEDDADRFPPVDA